MPDLIWFGLFAASCAFLGAIVGARTAWYFLWSRRQRRYARSSQPRTSAPRSARLPPAGRGVVHSQKQPGHR